MSHVLKNPKTFSSLHIMATAIFTILLNTNCSRRILTIPSGNKWKSIEGMHMSSTSKIQIIQKGKLGRDKITEVRLIRSVPFQDLETLPDRRSLDQIIRDKSCPELATIFSDLPTIPITYLDSGPLDLSPRNSKRTFLISSGYELLVRTNSTNNKILILNTKTK